MNENDIIKSVACNLSEKRKAAALNNYEVLYNNINYVNDLLCSFLKFVTALQIDIEKNKDVKDVKEVDSKIMEIALKIVELRRQLQRL